MGSTVTRRASKRPNPKIRTSSTRRRPQRSEESRKTPVSHWINEIFSIGLILLAVFVSLSIFVASSPSSFSRVTNLIGPFGVNLGNGLFYAFGYSSLLIAFWLAFHSVRWWEKDEWKDSVMIRSINSEIFGLICFISLGSSLGYLLSGELLGGSFGYYLSHALESKLGFAGALLLISLLIAISLPFATGLTPKDLAAKSAKGAVSGTKIALIDVPKTAWGWSWKLGEIFSFLFEKIGNSTQFIFNRPEEEEELELPKPRLRKNKIEIESEEEEDPIEEDVFSHVVVARRDAKKNSLRKVIKPKKVEASNQPYEFPSTEILTKGEVSSGNENDEELVNLSRLIEAKLKDFSINGRVTHVHPGPVITLFEFEPAAGVKVSRIVPLQGDLAMGLKAPAVRIIAPIPGKGTVGIEVPNKHRDVVRLRDLLESEPFQTASSVLSVPLGKDTYGDPVVEDIANMPHLLIAGATGTGKSVCINALLLSLLYRSSPEEMGLILIDPKILELSVYDGIPHLRVPVVTVPRQAKAVLDWAAKEMDQRYRLMQKYGVRNIDSYNKLVKGEINKNLEEEKSIEKEGLVSLTNEDVISEGTVDNDINVDPVDPIAAETLKPLPKIVIVIDELADLMLTVGREIEELITRLAQKARAAGIHLIVATQRPSVDVITGLIKANFPARMSFRVTTRIDSRTILDSMGAETLLGKGDMLYMQPGMTHLRRLHGAFVTDSEVQKVVSYVKSQGLPSYDARIMAMCEKAMQEEREGVSSEDAMGSADEYDEFYDKAVELVVQKGAASTSMIQRVFRIGYNRAARIIDMMEREGVVGPMDGVKPREVLLQNIEE